MNTDSGMSTFSKPDWEKYAACYDSLLKLRPYVDMIKKVVNTALSIQQETILDASCGTGNFETAFFDVGNNNTTVTGIDTSSEMLARAKEKCKKLSNARFLNADLNEILPFKNESFDTVVSINTLYAVSSPKKTLAEFCRVLKKEGMLILVTPKHGYENGFILKEHCNSPLSDEYWANAHANAEREEKIIREAIDGENVIQDMLTVAKYNRNIACNRIFHFLTINTLAKLLQENGFVIQNISMTYADQAIFIIANKN